MHFLKVLAKIFFVNMEKLFIADLLANGLHEKVMICSMRYVPNSRLDVQFVKENLLVNGHWSTDERRGV